MSFALASRGTVCDNRNCMKTAGYWHKREDGRICCELCPHHCVIAEGRTGFCHVRQARNAELHATTYGLVSSAALDPVEKKPLYHFHPGCEILSIGGWGCNFTCDFCQNWQISQNIAARGRTVEPSWVAAEAGHNGSVGVAYTYNEPLIAIEFVSDCARLVRDKGLVNVLVTNGYILPGPAAELLPLIDALNIDIKSMDDAFYREYCHGTLAPVLAFSEQAVQAGCHLEVTNLVIPGRNDTPDHFARLSEWIAGHLGKHTPLHLSAYRPMYRCETPRTGEVVLHDAYRRCRESLDYVYLGNVAGLVGHDTTCAECGRTLISRSGYATRMIGLTAEGACTGCGAALPFIP